MSPPKDDPKIIDLIHSAAKDGLEGGDGPSSPFQSLEYFPPRTTEVRGSMPLFKAYVLSEARMILSDETLNPNISFPADRGCQHSTMSLIVAKPAAVSVARLTALTVRSQRAECLSLDTARLPRQALGSWTQ